MSDKMTKANQQSEELSDEALEAVAGGSNSANLTQQGIADNSGVGAAVNLQSADISQIEKKLHVGGFSY